MKIYVKCFCNQQLPEIIEKGDWIDLRAAETIEMKAPFANTLTKNRTIRNVEFDFQLIPLGVAMKLPKGFEAVVLPRSSTYKKYKIMLANSQGVIDQTYCGNNDQWFMPVVAFDNTVINEGDRICQFRIQLSQFATPWQKIKWLFSKKIEIVKTASLSEESRGGIGSTGVN